ncbi:Uncharacterised protein [Clostridioides difficile]|nr:Uncharacterised protein [Clostridioides difficile]
MAALPIIIFGGSPIRVAVPPIFEAKICVIKNGTGLSPNICVITIVIGPISKTVVTLSNTADKIAVIIAKQIIIFHGSPLAFFAVQIAIYSNNPEFLTTATNSIIPTNTPIVLKSIWLNPSSSVSILNIIINSAPPTAATDLFTFSVIIAAITIKNIHIAIIC